MDDQSGAWATPRHEYVYDTACYERWGRAVETLATLGFFFWRGGGVSFLFFFFSTGLVAGRYYW